MSHRRNGKVARLPKAFREQVNIQLDEGKTYAKIIVWLAENGHPGFTLDNLSQWYAGGYQDWLKQEKLSAVAVDIVRQSDGSKTEQAARDIATARIFETLMDFDPDTLIKRLNTRPEHFTTVLNTFTRLHGR